MNLDKIYGNLWLSIADTEAVLSASYPLFDCTCNDTDDDSHRAAIFVSANLMQVCLSSVCCQYSSWSNVCDSTLAIQRRQSSCSLSPGGCDCLGLSFNLGGAQLHFEDHCFSGEQCLKQVSCLIQCDDDESCETTRLLRALNRQLMHNNNWRKYWVWTRKSSKDRRRRISSVRSELSHTQAQSKFAGFHSRASCSISEFLSHLNLFVFGLFNRLLGLFARSLSRSLVLPRHVQDEGTKWACAPARTASEGNPNESSRNSFLCKGTKCEAHKQTCSRSGCGPGKHRRATAAAAGGDEPKFRPVGMAMMLRAVSKREPDEGRPAQTGGRWAGGRANEEATRRWTIIQLQPTMMVSALGGGARPLLPESGLECLLRFGLSAGHQIPPAYPTDAHNLQQQRQTIRTCRHNRASTHTQGSCCPGWMMLLHTNLLQASCCCCCSTIVANPPERASELASWLLEKRMLFVLSNSPE